MKKEFVIEGIVIAIQVQMKKLNNGFWGNPGLLLNQGIFIIYNHYLTGIITLIHLHHHLLHRIPTKPHHLTLIYRIFTVLATIHVKPSKPQTTNSTIPTKTKSESPKSIPISALKPTALVNFMTTTTHSILHVKPNPLKQIPHPPKPIINHRARLQPIPRSNGSRKLLRSRIEAFVIPSFQPLHQVSVQAKVVDCFDMVKNEEDDKNEEDLIKYEGGVYKSEEIVVLKSECDNEIIEANKNEEDGRLLCDCGEIVVDESTEVVLKSGNSVQGQLVDCFEVVKNVGENVKNVEEDDDKIVFSILGIFTQPMVEAIDLGDASSVVRQIVGTLCMGFENVKIKGARRRQWQIAWAFSVFRWTIVSVPLWIWDEQRREFSVGVYHSHKSNMGLRSIVVQLVHFRVL